MAKNSSDFGLQEFDKRLVLKGQVDPSVAPIIDRAKAKGWKSINVQGNWELCRATWFEGRMAGLEVRGYRPNREDEQLLQKMEEQRKKISGTEIVLSGGDIAQDYNARVIPFLQKRYDDLRKQRSKLGVTTTDTDRAYGINLPVGHAREVDERFDRAKGAFLRAIDSRDFFLTVSRQRVPVKFSFEDGVARFVVRGTDKFALPRDGQGRELSRRQS